MYKIRAPSVKLPLTSWLFIITFNLFCSHHQQWFKHIYIYIINSSDNLTNTFMNHEMYGCQCMILKEIHIFKSTIIFFNCVQSHKHIHLKEKKQALQCTNSKMLFVKRNFHLLKI